MFLWGQPLVDEFVAELVHLIGVDVEKVGDLRASKENLDTSPP